MSLKSRLIFQHVAIFFVGIGILFLPAGTIHFWQAWVFLAILFIPMAIFSVYFYKRDPAVLARRMQRREKQTAQKWIMSFAAVASFAGFMAPSFDHRFGWTRRWFGEVPLWVEIVAQLVVLAGYLGTMWVVGVNHYAARTIQVEEGQKVISTGPYSWIRHPMYFFALIMWMAVPPALGSYAALPIAALLIPVLVLRLLNEEKFLRRELAGYEEYCRATPHHLIPYIW